MAELASAAALTDGQTVYLRAGIHDIDADLTFAQDSLTFQPYQAEVAKIRFTAKCNLNLNGDNMQVSSLELYSDPATRKGAARYDYPAVGAVNVAGVCPATGTFIGCVLHDLLTVGGFSSNGDGGLVYAQCILYNFGYTWGTGETLEGGDGESLYIHTRDATASPARGVKKSALLGFPGQVIQVYSGSGLDANNLIFEDLIYINAQNPLIDNSGVWFARSPGDLRDLVLRRFYTWGTPLSLGLAGANQRLTLEDSYLVYSAVQTKVNDWDGITVDGNVLVGRTANNLFEIASPSGTVAVDNNTYHSPDATPFNLSLTFAQWQALGYDAAGSFSASDPTTTISKLIALTVGSWKALVYVANWEETNTVDIDVSSLSLANGDYRLRNLMNFYNAAPTAVNNIMDFTYAGSGIVTVDFRNRSTALPTGETINYMPDTSPQFGAWLLEQLS